MPMSVGNLAPPSEDRRWRLVGATMRRHGYERDALIETLHTVQEAFGFLGEESLRYVAASLRVPLSQVYGAATFYHFFNLQPEGKHKCVLCLGTACYIKGAPAIQEAIQEDIGIGLGETTADGEVSLLIARCLGACGLAPAAVFDDEVVGKLDASDVVQRLHKWTEKP